jgi:nicotinamidase-related amidase
MPLTLDTRAALVAIDLQKGVVGMPLPRPATEIVDKSAALARAFRARDLPVVWVNVSGRAPGRTAQRRSFNFPPDWDLLAPELGVEATDFRVTKQQVGAFYGTALELILRRNGVSQIVLTGIATSSGVEATARAAYDMGFNVVTVIDAMTDGDEESHRHAVEKQFPKFSETATTEEILIALGAAPADAAK